MAMGSVVPFGWGGSMPPSRASNNDPFIRLWNDVDQLFGNVFRGSGGLTEQRPTGMIGLPLEVSETGAELKVVAELPGVEEKDVSVELVGDVLTVKGEKKPRRSARTRTTTSPSATMVPSRARCGCPTRSRRTRSRRPSRTAS